MNRPDYQRRLVDRYLAAEIRPRHTPESPVMRSFARRLDAAWQAGLFESSHCSPWDPVSPTQLVSEQARIATEVYGLTYRSEGKRSCWVASGQPDQTRKGRGEGRTPQWLQNLLSRDRDNGIDKLDLLLLGEVFRLPMESWELPEPQNGEEDGFTRHVALAKKGINLLASGMDFFIENAAFFHRKGAGRDPIIITQDGQRAVKVEPETVKVRCDTGVIVTIPFPEGFESSQVLLLEWDQDGDVSLISPSRLVDNDPWFEGRTASVPRNGKPLCLGVPGRSTLIAVLAAAPGNRREPLLPLLDDGTGDMLPLVGGDVLDGLKSRLLELGPDRWCIKQRVCWVVQA